MPAVMAKKNSHGMAKKISHVIAKGVLWLKEFVICLRPLSGVAEALEGLMVNFPQFPGPFRTGIRGSQICC